MCIGLFITDDREVIHKNDDQFLSWQTCLKSKCAPSWLSSCSEQVFSNQRNKSQVNFYSSLFLYINMSLTKAMLLKMSKDELVGFAMSAMTKNEQITKSVIEELETMKGKLEAIESRFLISANANS